MKFTIPVVIEITPEQAEELTAEYGIKTTEIRTFISGHVLNGVQSAEGHPYGFAASEFWTATLDGR